MYHTVATSVLFLNYPIKPPHPTLPFQCSIKHTKVVFLSSTNFSIIHMHIGSTMSLYGSDSVFVDRLLSVTSLIMHNMPPHMDTPHPPIPASRTRPFLLRLAHTGRRDAPWLQQGHVSRGTPTFIDQNVECLLKDTSFRELNLCEQMKIMTLENKHLYTDEIEFKCL